MRQAKLLQGLPADRPLERLLLASKVSIKLIFGIQLMNKGHPTGDIIHCKHVLFQCLCSVQVTPVGFLSNSPSCSSDLKWTYTKVYEFQ